MMKVVAIATYPLRISCRIRRDMFPLFVELAPVDDLTRYLERHPMRFHILLIGLAFGALGCGEHDGLTDGSVDGGGLDAPVDDASTDGQRPGDVPIVEDGLSPVLSNFRVSADQPSRVYFDSNKFISGATSIGFVVSDASVVAIFVNEGATSGHYLELAAPLSFWDNNTVRYEGGGDLQDLGGRPLLNFTLTYIENEIPEPDAPEDRYVNASAGGGGDDLSDATAWTWAEALNSAEPGQTVWLKAGDYGDLELESRRSGTESAPIKFIGYTNRPGDITGSILDTFEYLNPENANTVIDDSRFPVLRGTNRDATGLFIDGESFLIFRNIQFERYHWNIWIYNASDGLVFDNITTANARIALDDDSGMNFFNGATGTGRRHRFIRSLSFDASGANYRSYASNSLVKDSGFYAGIVGQWDTRPYDQRATDYYVSLFGGSDSIMINNVVHQVGELTHGGHAIGIRGQRECARNLFDGNTAFNTDETYYVSTHLAHHNVFKNNRAVGETRGVAALVARDGTHDNVFDSNYAERADQCITQWSSLESEGTTYVSLNNTFMNNVFNGYVHGMVFANEIGALHSVTNVRIYNNTFYDGTGALFYSSADGTIDFVDSEFRNNIVATSARLYLSFSTDADFLKEHNAWSELSYAMPTGTGNVEAVPLFRDIAAGDLSLSPDTPVTIRQGGATLTGVLYDIAGVQRTEPYSMGAHELD